MKNDELLKSMPVSQPVRRTFAYHYDQIQREVQTEILHQPDLLEQLKNN